MRLAVDAGLGSSRYGGLGGYILRLVRGLAAMPGFEVAALVPAHYLDHNELGVLPGGSRVVPVDVGREDLGFYDRRSYWEQEVLPATLASGDYDAYFGPTLVLPLDWPGPKVVAVHDLAFEVAPDFNTPLSTAFYSRWARASAEAAAGVVAISKATANDLEQRWGISETVTVTPLASCLDFVPSDRRQSARLVNRDPNTLASPGPSSPPSGSAPATTPSSGSVTTSGSCTSSKFFTFPSFAECSASVSSTPKSWSPTSPA